MSTDEAYAAVIRQAAQDAVRALLAAAPDSLTGSRGLRAVTHRLAVSHGAGAVMDLAEELAVDLAEAFAALAGAEGQSAQAVADGWFHDLPAPSLAATTLATADDREDADAGAPARSDRGFGGETT